MEKKLLIFIPLFYPNLKVWILSLKYLKIKKKKTGCTVHYVDEKLDNGKIISQKSFFIDTKDDEEKLKKKTQKLEYLVFPESIIKIFQNN